MIRFTNEDHILDAFEARTIVKPPMRPTTSTKVMLDMKAFLARESDEDRRDRLRDLFEFCLGQSLVLSWGITGVSIRVPNADRPEPLSIGWVFPTGTSGWLGLTGLMLGVDHQSAAVVPTLASAVQQYLDAVTQLDGTTPTKPPNLTAVTFDPDAEAHHNDTVKDLLGALAEAGATT